MLQPALPPPVRETGTLAWMRRNLFSNLWNALISVVALVVIAWGVLSLLNWMVFAANWDRVWANLRLMSIFRYPIELVWRPMASVMIVIFLFGMSAGLSKDGTGRIVRSAYNWMMGFVGFITLVALFAFPSVRFLWIAVVVLGVAGFWLARAVPVLAKALPWLWIASWFVSLFFLLGVGGNGNNPTGLEFVPPNLWGGIILTFFFSVTGIVLCFPLGIALALGRQSKLPAIKYFCIFYIEIIRGAPLITWLFTASLLLPLFLGGIRPEAIIRAQVAIVLFAAAYMAENVRGGLQALPKGQREAAHALGLTPWDSMRLIILPQALRSVIPAIVGLFIGLFKDTSLITIVGLFDLFAVALKVATQPESKLIAGGIVRELFIFMAIFYWFFCFRMSVASRQLEQELGLGTR
ncbi:MAG: amino acid ABC transporter permease [Trueperaceae bacterium]|nr:amino acid ABC transporter permease [Trueperaceae bacterium]